MEEVAVEVKELEMKIWEAASKRDGKKFLELVSEDAIMVYGGARCTGKEYAKVIEEFNLSGYRIEAYETVLATDRAVQNHYVITTEVNEGENKEFAGTFHVTSTWEKKDEKWQLIYNMDARV